MKKVLITGGSGFLGLWVAKKLLDQHYQVRIADIQPNLPLAQAILGSQATALDWTHTDVTSLPHLRTAVEGCDHIVHLAGLLTPQCRANPLYAYQVNYQSLLYLFELAREFNLPQVIYASTAGVYGPQHNQYPEPITFYGAFKLGAEHIARAYWTDSNPDQQVASIGLRPLVVYGPGRVGGASAGPSIACAKALAQEAYSIPFSGPTGFIYVEDVSEIILRSLQNPPSGAHVLNLSGVIAHSEDVAQEISKQTGFKHIHVHGPSLGIQIPTQSLTDYPWLGPLQYTSIQDGISKTLNFERARHE